MALTEFETALSAEGWSQQEMDDLRSMIGEIITLREVYRMANMEFSAALSRWNGGVSAKVASLGALFAIPNPTDIAGANDIAKEVLANNLMAYVTTVEALGTQDHLNNILPLIGHV